MTPIMENQMEKETGNWIYVGAFMDLRFLVLKNTEP